MKEKRGMEADCDASLSALNHHPRGNSCAAALVATTGMLVGFFRSMHQARTTLLPAIITGSFTGKRGGRTALQRLLSKFEKSRNTIEQQHLRELLLTLLERSEDGRHVLSRAAARPNGVL